tara:strand:+ start:549 stop:863 length:315 start_codon:yes stop_codon:yes gene_type:complete
MRELEKFISCGGQSRENFVSSEQMTDKDRNELLDKINKQLDRLREIVNEGETSSKKEEEKEEKKEDDTTDKEEKREGFVNRNSILYCIFLAIVMIMVILWLFRK